MKVGIVAGSFDPITNGHTSLIKQAMSVVDYLHVVVGHNPAKKYMFNPDERAEMVRNTMANEFGTEYYRRSKVVISTDELLVHYAQRVHANFLIRGVRNSEDFNYEAQMRLINQRIDPNIETVLFMADRKLTEVSSSVVKGLIGFGNWEQIVSDYVSPPVLECLKQKHQK